MKKEIKEKIKKLILEILETHQAPLTQQEIRVLLNDRRKKGKRIVNNFSLSKGRIIMFLKELKNEGKVSYVLRNRIGFWETKTLENNKKARL